MGKQTRTALKNYFQTGKVPTQGQYEDLIDSYLNLAQTDTQIIAGEVSSSTLNVGFHITASGNISASGDVIAATASFGVVSGSDLHLEASNDVKIRLDNKSEGSGHLRIYEGGSSNPFFQIKDDGKTVIGGSAINTSASAMLTVNGDISGSATSNLHIGTASLGVITGSLNQPGNLGVNFMTPITASQDINCLGTIFGTLGTTSTVTSLGILTALNVNGNTFITGSNVRIDMSASEPFEVVGDISSSGNIYASNYYVEGKSAIDYTEGQSRIVFGQNSQNLRLRGATVTLGADNTQHTTIQGNAIIDGTLSYGGATLTATATELNALDGITSTVAELNLVDGLTTAEMNQVKNIGTSTISSAQWGYVGNMDQHVNSASGVNFRSLYIVDSITMPIQKSFSTAYGVNMAIGVDDVRRFNLTITDFINIRSNHIAPGTIRIAHDTVTTKSIILASGVDEFSPNITTVTNGQFYVTFTNVTPADSSLGNKTFNFLIINDVV